jgi:spermidine synthase
MYEMVEGYRVVARNFYGQLRVVDSGNPAIDDDAVRRFVHGTINHGEQALVAEYRRRPITYFCEQSGIGRAMRSQMGAPRRIGILGLGCGTLAAYGRAGDTLRIYEINPLVVDIANREFSYLRDTEAKVEVALGDGRLVLESEPDQHFDILVMDAFSGDSVPVHLITREALATYFRHLKPDGILAINVTNMYLDLRPVVERAANAFHKVAYYYHFTPDADDEFCFACSWSLIMDAKAAAAHPELQNNAQMLRPTRPFRLWTDDFSNMLAILK